MLPIIHSILIYTSRTFARSFTIESTNTAHH